MPARRINFYRFRDSQFLARINFDLLVMKHEELVLGQIRFLTNLS